MSINEFKNIKILFVEDEDNIRINATSYLKRLFDEVYEAKDAFEAFEIIELEKPHIIITDINMPKLNGLEMIKKIREKNNHTNIVVLSAYTQTSYLLEAIELGLVKYLIKPIRHETIYPVLSQCVKRIRNDNKTNMKYFSKSCYFDFLNKKLIKDEEEVKLTNKELDLLCLLCECNNQTVTYETIQAIVWNDSFMSEDAIRSVARNLRKKLPVKCLENLSKIGYKIVTID